MEIRIDGETLNIRIACKPGSKNSNYPLVISSYLILPPNKGENNPKPPRGGTGQSNKTK